MPSESHTQEQISAFLKEVKSQTDRGAAIIAAAVLDDLLEQVILARLIALGSERRDTLFDKTGAPLTSFSAKIEMSFALGVISNEARLALHLIRDVRNAFAHRIEQVTFDHPTVVEMIDKRIIGPLQKDSSRSNRVKVLDSFSVMAMLLYATLLADIRIKPLE